MKAQSCLSGAIPFLAAALAACATPSQRGVADLESQFAVMRDVSFPLHRKIALSQVGGVDEKAEAAAVADFSASTGQSEIGNVEFREIFRAALDRTALLSEAGGEAKFQLQVSVIKFDLTESLTLTIVGSSLSYKLIRIRDGRVVDGAIVVGSYEATGNDSILSSSRRKIAYEGSIRQNVDMYLIQLKGLKPAALQ